jgi:ubiquinone/menaquinone biosynthesis C-methylase UbiE
MDYFKKLYLKIKNGNPNSFRYQKNWAKRFINSGRDDFSNEWGAVNKINPRLGDYTKVAEDITKFGQKFTNGECLDVGCLDGKWATVLANSFSKVHLTDLTDLLVDHLSLKLQDKMGRFYKTRGDELKGFDPESIDFVFSMDSLVRAPKKSIFNYFSEFHRILRHGGLIYIHLPVVEKPRCVSKGFTSLKVEEIGSKLKYIGFTGIAFDMETLEHGAIVCATKE